jgi:uncharacterized protein
VAALIRELATRPGPPVMVHRWARISFLHWRYEAAEVQRLVPEELQVEEFDGSAWVGLTPFLLSLRPPGLPFLPRLTDVPEMNVRTYVRAADGSSGIWFFSLDIARLSAVAGARLTYRLPYYWSRFLVRAGDRLCAYRCTRISPGPPAVTDVEVEVGDSVGEGARLAEFLTARWRLYTRFGRAIWQGPVQHPPWPLRDARVGRWRAGHLAAAGLRPPVEDPIVHWSRGVEVKVGAPRPTLAGAPDPAG